MPSTDLIELYLGRLAERGCTEATLDTYGRVLTLADQRLPFGLDQANEDELRAYLFRGGRPLARSSQRTYHVILGRFYSWAEEARVLKFNPMKDITAPKTTHYMPRAAEDHQVRWVLTEAIAPFRLWGVLAAFGNLRCVEVSRLHREHVTQDAITIARGKGDKPRVVPTHPFVWEAISNLAPGPVTDHSPRDISIKFWKYARRGGMHDVSMHRLRGWYATQGYAVSNDLLAVQRLMGHADPRTTAGYIRTTTDQARAVVDGLPTFGVSVAAMRAA